MAVRAYALPPSHALRPQALNLVGALATARVAAETAAAASESAMADAGAKASEVLAAEKALAMAREALEAHEEALEAGDGGGGGAAAGADDAKATQTAELRAAVEEAEQRAALLEDLKFAAETEAQAVAEAGVAAAEALKAAVAADAAVRQQLAGAKADEKVQLDARLRCEAALAEFRARAAGAAPPAGAASQAVLLAAAAEAAAAAASALAAEVATPAPPLLGLPGGGGGGSGGGATKAEAGAPPPQASTKSSGASVSSRFMGAAPIGGWAGSKWVLGPGLAALRARLGPAGLALLAAVGLLMAFEIPIVSARLWKGALPPVAGAAAAAFKGGKQGVGKIRAAMPAPPEDPKKAKARAAAARAAQKKPPPPAQVLVVPADEGASASLVDAPLPHFPHLPLHAPPDASGADHGHEHGGAGAGMMDVITLLATSVIAVPIVSKLPGGSPVLGFLVGGAVIGPAALGLIANVETVKHIAEIGVVFLLFNIGLELSLERLQSMAKYVFGLGVAQMVVTTLAAAAVVHVTAGLAAPAAMVVGVGLAFSSTAVAMQVLADRGEASSRHGRAAFSVLLLQDLAVVLVFMLVPLLSGDIVGAVLLKALALAVAKTGLAIALIMAVGRVVLRPVYRRIADLGNTEMFSATTLLVALGTSTLTAALGLSAALGAFLAGLLLAETEYHLQARGAPTRVGLAVALGPRCLTRNGR